MANLLTYAVPLVMVAVTVWFILRMRRPRKPKADKDDHQTRLGRAVWAWATIVNSSVGPVDLGGKARVEMQLEVHMPGSQPYNATTTWLVEQEALAYVNPGKEISLKVDPLAQKYVYPNGPWAKFVD